MPRAAGACGQGVEGTGKSDEKAEKSVHSRPGALIAAPAAGGPVIFLLAAQRAVIMTL